VRGREGKREGGREGAREGGREGGRHNNQAFSKSLCNRNKLKQAHFKLSCKVVPQSNVHLQSSQPAIKSCATHRKLWMSVCNTTLLDLRLPVL